MRTPKYDQRAAVDDDTAALAIALDNEAVDISDADIVKKKDSISRPMGYNEAKQLLGYDPSVPIEPQDADDDCSTHTSQYHISFT